MNSIFGWLDRLIDAASWWYAPTIPNHCNQTSLAKRRNVTIIATVIVVILIIKRDHNHRGHCRHHNQHQDHHHHHHHHHHHDHHLAHMCILSGHTSSSFKYTTAISLLDGINISCVEFRWLGAQGLQHVFKLRDIIDIIDICRWQKVHLSKTRMMKIQQATIIIHGVLEDHPNPIVFACLLNHQSGSSNTSTFKAKNLF